jgi:hypothetical protein
MMIYSLMLGSDQQSGISQNLINLNDVPPKIYERFETGLILTTRGAKRE